MYLAASCVNYQYFTQTYYIFWRQDFTALSNSNWNYYSGPFGYSTLPSGSYTNNSEQDVNSVTEFDWAQRADGTMAAVVRLSMSFRQGQVTARCPSSTGAQP